MAFDSVHLPFIFRSFCRPFCRFTLVYEGHFVLCYKEKTRALIEIVLRKPKNGIYNTQHSCLVLVVITMSKTVKLFPPFIENFSSGGLT